MNSGPKWLKSRRIERPMTETQVATRILTPNTSLGRSVIDRA